MEKPKSHAEKEKFVGKMVINTQDDEWNGCTGKIIGIAWFWNEVPKVRYNSVPEERRAAGNTFTSSWQNLELLGSPNERNRQLLRRKKES
jgi:hypothetical protein